MAYRATVNDPETVKVWGRGAEAVAVPKTALFRLTGKGTGAIVREYDELKKGKGDRIRNLLRKQSTDVGAEEGEVLEGQEEGLDFAHDDLVIGQMRKATRFEWEGTTTEQRVPVNLREEAKYQNTDWVAERFDQILFNHACGYTPANSFTKANLYNGYNTIVDYEAAARITAGSGSTDQSITNTDTMTAELIDAAIELAKTRDIPLMPGRYNGGEGYSFVMFLHPYQVRSLKEQSGTFAEWLRAAAQGGRVDDNPLMTGAIGVWNGCLLVESTRVTQGVNSSSGAAISTVRRSPVLGANSLCMGFGRHSSTPDKFKWIEKLFDYDNELGIALSFIFGMKRNIFDSESYGSILVSTYAAAA